MKNLMDFCIGFVVFVTLGSGLMLAEDYIVGVIGMPNLDIFTNWDNYNWSSFVFNLVFCATAATIVSGAMAERTKFSAYCIYNAVISAVVYPIEAGWVWNTQGWLYKLGFIDYAGSAAIHMVGGTAALIGAIFLGPRIGKYVTKADGKKEARAIPGHSITIGSLGVFILWFACTASTARRRPMSAPSAVSLLPRLWHLHLRLARRWLTLGLKTANPMFP